MPDLPTFALFVTAGLLLNFTPGPDMALVIARAAQGWRVGVAAALGIGAGSLVHTLAAAIGVSALLATSATAFNVVKWLGAAYLAYVGLAMLWRSWRAPKVVDAIEAQPLPPTDSVFWQGFLTNVLNPKVALFFVAFLPQFVDPAASDRAWAMLLLGVVFVVNGTLVCVAIAWLTARGAARWRGSPAARDATRWLERALGVFFIALAARLAAARST